MPATQKDNLRYLSLVSIRPSEVALRSVDKDDEKYHGIRDSIAQVGVINPISVREIKDSETGKTVYGIIDGLHRYTGSIDAGLDTIPAHIIQADEAKVLEMQIIGNLHVVETKPAEYSKQLHKLLALNPTMTTLELANKLGKSITWLTERFNLVKLSDNIQELVNDGTINITNACNLAKLPPEEQPNFVDRAMTMTPAEFVPTVTIRAKQIRDAKRQGRSETSPKVFEPPVFMQKLSALKSELKDLNIGKSLINQHDLKEPLEVWKMCVAWVLHLDPISIEVSRLADEERKKLNEENKAKKKDERNRKKQLEASSVAANIALDEEEEDE